MIRVKLLLVLCFSFTAAAFFSQDYFSYGNSNYAGVVQVIANPAAAAGNKLQLDVLAAGLDLTFNNSWAGVRREAIAFPSLPASWKYYTPNMPGNIYKNFDWKEGDNNKEVLLEHRILLPSVLVSIDSVNSLAFSCSMRQIGNMRGISAPLARLFENEFDLSVLQNNPVQNKDFVAIRMSWMEYGFTYARVIANKKGHRLKAGITPKLLQGLESSYFILKDLNFLFSNKDTLSYFEADFEVAHSARAGSALEVGSYVSQKFRQSAGLVPGLDLGLIYEWRPVMRSSGNASVVPGSKRALSDTYKLKAAVSLVDIGKIRFKKEQNYYDIDLSIRQNDIIKYISAENVQMIDSILSADFPSNTGEGHFSVLLPAALNMQLDYGINSRFYLNIAAHLTGFNRLEYYKVRNYSAVCLSPRYESYWMDLALLLTWNQLSASRSKPITPGISLRFGPLAFGSSDLSFLFKDNISSLNFYAMLRFSIPYKRK